MIDASYGKSFADADAGVAANFHSGGDGNQGNSATKVGLKGSTEVAKGIKANFQLETAGITTEGKVGTEGYYDDVINTNVAGTAFFDRAAWVGFSGSFGEVRLGRQDSVSFQTMVGFDFNGAANMASAQGNAGVATWGPGRQSRSLQYIAPAMGAFKAQVGFVPEDSVAATKATTSLGLSYSVGAFAAAVTGESKRTETASNFMSVAASYDFKVAKVMAGYADGSSVDSTSGLDVVFKGATVGIVAPVAGFNVGLNYSKNTEANKAATEFFVNREIFKNTSAYADFANVDANGTKSNAYAVGVIYAF